MSALTDLIAAARASAVDDTEHRPNAAQLERLADAAEKELADRQTKLQAAEWAGDALEEQLREARIEAVKLQASVSVLSERPRMDLEALRGALIIINTDSPQAEDLRWAQQHFRSLLAQLEDAKGQPAHVCDGGYINCPACAPKPEAQMCPECGGQGIEVGPGDNMDVSACFECDGTGKVGGGA